MELTTHGHCMEGPVRVAWVGVPAPGVVSTITAREGGRYGEEVGGNGRDNRIRITGLQSG